MVLKIFNCRIEKGKLTMNSPVKRKAAAADSKLKVLQRYPPAIGPKNDL